MQLARRLFLLICVTAVVGTIAFRCGGGSSGDSVSFKNRFTGTVEVPDQGEAAELVAGFRNVTFTIEWSEENGEVIGQYTDDYFAKKPVSLTGTVNADGTRTIKIALRSAIGEVAILDVTVSAASGAASDVLTITKFAGANGSGGTVFEKNDISIKSIGGTGSGGSGTGSATEFFAANAGTYEYFANNTNGTTDTTFTHGKKYAIVVTADGKITFPADAGAVEMTYGANPADKFEHYDHEEYVTINVANGAVVLFQVHFDENGKHFSYDIKGDVATFWSFKETEPGEVQTQFQIDNADKLGMIGTFDATITQVVGKNSSNPTIPPQTGTTITIAKDGTLTTDVDGWKSISYSATTTSITPVGASGCDTPAFTIYYCAPTCSANPRKLLELQLCNNKLKKGSYTEIEEGANQSTYYKFNIQ